MRALFPAHNQRLLTMSCCCGGRGKEALWGLLPGHQLHSQRLHPMPLASSKSPTSSIIAGVRISTYRLWGDPNLQTRAQQRSITLPGYRYHSSLISPKNIKGRKKQCPGIRKSLKGQETGQIPGLDSNHAHAVSWMSDAHSHPQVPEASLELPVKVCFEFILLTISLATNTLFYPFPLTRLS